MQQSRVHTNKFMKIKLFPSSNEFQFWVLDKRASQVSVLCFLLFFTIVLPVDFCSFGGKFNTQFW